MPDHVTSAWHCNVCGKLYYDFEQAEKCEKQHIQIVKWVLEDMAMTGKLKEK